MHLGDIYKRLTSNHFVLIQGFATYIDEDKNKKELDDDILVVISNLIVVDGMLVSDPVGCHIGTQKEVEDKYCLYKRQDEINDMELELISLKVQQQNEIDDREIDDMFAKLEPEVIENLKRDIDELIKEHKEGK